MLVVLARLLVTDPTGETVLKVINGIFWVSSSSSSCCAHTLLGFNQVSGATTGGRLFSWYCHSYDSSERSRPCESYASHESAGSSRQEFEGRDPLRVLSNRVAWLIAVTAIIILGASQLIYIFADYSSYPDALYEAALTTITGAGLSSDTVFVHILHIVFAIFSIVSSCYPSQLMGY